MTVKCSPQFSLKTKALTYSFLIVVLVFTSITGAYAADLPNDIFQLLPSDGSVAGRAIAVSDSPLGKFAVVGSGAGNLGSAHAFRWNGSAWDGGQKLTNSDNANITRGVAIDGEVAVTSSPSPYTNGVNTGATYIFRFNGTSWVQEQRLPIGIGSAGGEGGHMTKALSISGDVLIVGNFFDAPSQQGSVSVYRYHPERAAGDRWILEQKLISPEIAQGYGKWFGYSAVVSNSRIVVGTPHDSVSGTSAGAVYVFRFDGSSWILEQRLSPSDPAAYKKFGVAVALHNNTIAVGANGTLLSFDGGRVGPAVYVYQLNNGIWTEESILPSDGFGRFGEEIAANSDAILIKSCMPAKYYIFRKYGSEWRNDVAMSNILNGRQPLNDIPSECLGSVSASGGLLAIGSFDTYIQGAYVMPPVVEQPHLVLVTAANGVSGTGTGTVTPGNVIVAHGKNKTFTISPNPGYVLHDVLLDEQSVGPVSTYTLSNVVSDHKISGVFRQPGDSIPPVVYPIGTGSNWTNSGPSQISAITAIRANASDNASIRKVEFYAGSSSNPYATLLGTSLSSSASIDWDTTPFENGSYLITAKAYDTASPTPNTAIAQRTITIQNGLFRLSNGGNKTVTQGGSVSQNINVARLTSNSYYNQFIATGLPSGVSASFSPNACTTDCSTTMTLTASSAATPGTFQITVTFASNTTNFNLTVNRSSGDNTQYTLSTSTTGWNGTVTPSPNQVAYTTGTQVTLTAIPTTGIFSHWSGCNSGTQNPLILTMNQNKNCTAHFAFTATPPASITASAGPGGSISPYGTIFNPSQVFSLFPLLNHRLSNVIVDGVSVGAVTTYAFSNVTGNHSINAVFEPYAYTLTNGGERSVAIGGSTTNLITATLTQGSAPPISFSISGVSGLISASFNPSTCTPSCTSVMTITTSPSLAAGVYEVDVNATGQRQTSFNLIVGNPPLPPTIQSSSPINGYIDPLEDRDAGNITTRYGINSVSVTFSTTVKSSNNLPLSIGNFTTRCIRNGVPASDLQTEAVPIVNNVVAGANNTYQLQLSARLCLGAWTEIKAVNVVSLANTPISPTTGNRIVLGALPMDITQDGKVLGDDINRWLAIKNGTYALPTGITSQMLLDQERNGVIAGEDNTRGIQLLNGIGTYIVGGWNGFDMGQPPN